MLLRLKFNDSNRVLLITISQVLAELSWKADHFVAEKSILSMRLPFKLSLSNPSISDNPPKSEIEL